MFSSRCYTLVQRSSACRSTLLVHPYVPSWATFSTSVIARHNRSTASTVAQNVQSTAQSSTSPKNKKNAEHPGPQDEEKLKESAPPPLEEQLMQLNKLHGMEGQLHYDIWAHPLQTFDLHIPSWHSNRKDAGILDHFRAFWGSQVNASRNVVNMYRIAKAQSFPGVKVPRVWSIDLFKVQSTPWLKPFLKTALDNYKQINAAFAATDEKTLKALTVNKYYEHLHKRLRNQNPNLVYFWKFHGESEPCKVVSIRSAEVNMSRQPPKIGSRLAIQACVKFDTMQSLEVFTKKGGRIAGDGKPQRVVEYLVFQKRMWYDTPWTVRDQLYEELEAEYVPHYAQHAKQRAHSE